jgi:hypothetical protein
MERETGSNATSAILDVLSGFDIATEARRECTTIFPLPVIGLV